MNRKLLVSLFALLFLASFVSATQFYDYKEKISKTYYDKEENSAITRTISVSYDNDDRYSTYYYRNGYSYRESQDYWEMHHDYKDVRVIRLDMNRYDNRDDRYDRYDNRRYDNDWEWRYSNEKPNRVQYRYVPYLRDYEERECYDYTPHKLFYIGC
ncbi:MAG: hypothetical protein NUV97_00840 [archaeon]|nr:hypothetical protein [archaeon]MCR4323492.1 hypothetical protein [Nanoarchaeota archaeon]